MILEGDNIIIYDLRNGKRVVKVLSDRSLYINKQLLDLKILIGTELGLVYEWDGEVWKVVDSFDEGEFDFSVKDSSTDDVLNFYDSEFTGDNRNIIDDNTSQKLTFAEIDIWRNVTGSGMELVKHIADNSRSFGDKAIFSKEKYINKKRKKYLSAFKTMRVTLFDICDSYWLRNPTKIGFVRPDYLANILYSANLTHNSNVMILDHSMGLILAGVSQRIFNNSMESDALIYALVSKGVSDKIVHQCNITNHRIYPMDLNELVDSLNNINIANDKRPREDDSGDKFVKANPKNILYPTLPIPTSIYINSIIATVSYVKGLDTDILIDQIIAISDKLLAPSGTLVIFSQHIQPLIKQQTYLTKSDSYVQVRLEELFHREFQILPRRTHPIMHLDRVCTGFILSAIKIMQDDTDTI